MSSSSTIIIIKVKPVAIWPRVAIPCKYFSQGKTREEDFAKITLPINYLK
jgi:hypothetical protein